MVPNYRQEEESYQNHLYGHASYARPADSCFMSVDLGAFFFFHRQAHFKSTPVCLSFYFSDKTSPRETRLFRHFVRDCSKVLLPVLWLCYI